LARVAARAWLRKGENDSVSLNCANDIFSFAIASISSYVQSNMSRIPPQLGRKSAPPMPAVSGCGCWQRLERPGAITPMQSAAISAHERKQGLFSKALRIADKAADRIEDQIDTANISQTTIAFGVSTEKALMLAGEPTQIVQVNLAAEDIYSECRTGICSNPHPPLRDALPRIAARRDFGSPTIHAAVVRVALVANIKNRPCRSPFKADEVRHLRHDSFLTGTSETK